MFIFDKTFQEQLPASTKLFESVNYEIKYIYSIWNQDYSVAMKSIQDITRCLSGDDVKGFRSFWYYLAGSTAWLALKSGLIVFRDQIFSNYLNAVRCTNTIAWLNKLAVISTENADFQEDNYLSLLIEGLENSLNSLGLQSNRKFEKAVSEILTNLNSSDGNEFEKGHEKLGLLLGYQSGNSEGNTAPDPWWRLNNNICLVFEDKIYESEDKRIPTKHVIQGVLNDEVKIEKAVDQRLLEIF
ncbi:hypothetical protein [Gottfriedia acidiceleris]|uniref:hypothetical protein n=1 Tax=Gottfriedia acidiceleris TaxID=371036 RepID=UPI003D1A74ED